jgi:hypothetical protein
MTTALVADGNSKGKAKARCRGLGTQGLMDLGRGLCNLYRREKIEGINQAARLFSNYNQLIRSSFISIIN